MDVRLQLVGWRINTLAPLSLVSRLVPTVELEPAAIAVSYRKITTSKTVNKLAL